MNRTATPIDEHTLVAFLCDTLPLPERARVIRHLVVDDDARQLLVMARAAYAAGIAAPQHRAAA